MITRRAGGRHDPRLFRLAVSTVIANLDQIADLARTALSLRVPPPPSWLADIPLVGTAIARAWTPLTSARYSNACSKPTPYAGALTQWFASAAGSLGGLFVQFLLTVAVAAIMYAREEHAATLSLRFGRRLAGERGEMGVRLAGQRRPGRGMGVVVTAFAEEQTRVASASPSSACRSPPC